MPTLFVPQFGARFQLDRLAVDDAAANYAVRIYLPELLYEFALRVNVHTGDCVITPQGSTPADAPPIAPWVSKHLSSLGRQLYRSAKKDGLWQRRVMRWHGSPETTGQEADRIAS